ncbi:XRN 5'-3' exonuclease [Nitzschia inconspicua]|uniref:XRN 5'-3' exonuclease n=1 Tax=Nitzschia inconspicua TaxID=303405 RepID=A0A9K3LB15_9STRA|nr:XRN 5'-3' exonuclease [Nitzschia inconspicua]KAG7358673.1 XRN 5'-3' exonuclease [Nitzschia inconspicua]
MKRRNPHLNVETTTAANGCRHYTQRTKDETFNDGFSTLLLGKSGYQSSHSHITRNVPRKMKSDHSNRSSAGYWRCKRIPCNFTVVFCAYLVFCFQRHLCTVAFLPVSNRPSGPLLSDAIRLSRVKTTTTTTPTTPLSSQTALFGIKGFRQWFEQQFPSAVKSVNVDKYNDTFDHVLVDMNQILHVVLRRSRDEEQAIKLLMFELDTLIQRVRPTRSLVLAIDGSPAAAKLATQRKRRFTILRNTQFKLQHLDKLRGSKRLRAKRLRNYQSELQSLQLTPGTDCMRRMESALLYWAWQRLQSQGRPNSKLLPRVRIYLSTSQVPGEGEIKLLEWIHNFRGSLSKNPGQSVALIGGDADLLLEAMVLPPAWTHNVFVLRPDEGNVAKNKDASARRRSYMHCTSLWEMTLNLDEYCRSVFPAKYYNPKILLQIRNDLVLLLIMNGNDYLPGLVATSFRALFQCYMTLLEQWVVKHGCIDEAGLVDPNLLTFRLEFCVEFFRVLGKGGPSDKDIFNALQNCSRRTYQSILNDMIAMGFLPGPARFQFLSGNKLEGIQNLPPLEKEDRKGEDDNANSLEDSEETTRPNLNSELREDYDDNFDYDGEYGVDGDEEVNDEYEDSEEEEFQDDDEYEDFVQDGGNDPDEKLLVRLSIGQKSDGDYEMYQAWAGQSTTSIQKVKGKLAKMVLERHALLKFSEEKENLNSMDYSWEIEKPAESRVDRYLAGMLWTLQTYQDGICPSYGYNYGKCLAPTGRSIEEYLNRALAENRKVGAEELLKDYKFGGSVKAGVACLAALPSSVKNLVPEPYRRIDSGTIEDIYAKCMDPNDNFFQLEKFDQLVTEEVAKITKHGIQASPGNGDFAKVHPDGRRIILGDHYWSVLTRVGKSIDHPFQPPPPPADFFSPLSSNAFIKASRIISMDWPRPRPEWDAANFEEPTRLKDGSSGHFQESWLSKHNVEVDHMDFGSLLGSNNTKLQDIPFKIAFRNAPINEISRKGAFKVLKSSSLDTSVMLSSSTATPDEDRKPFLERRGGIASKNLDGQSSIVVLKQLRDIGIIDDYIFNDTASERGPSGSLAKMTILVVGGSLRSKRIHFSRAPLENEAKKATREYLASLALNFMIRYLGTKNDSLKNTTSHSSEFAKWHEFSFHQLKLLLTDKSLQQPTVTVANPENATAWLLLKQLSNVGALEPFELLEEEHGDPEGGC